MVRSPDRAGQRAQTGVSGNEEADDNASASSLNGAPGEIRSSKRRS
jgi:hypothetical protein